MNRYGTGEGVCGDMQMTFVLRFGDRCREAGGVGPKEAIATAGKQTLLLPVPTPQQCVAKRWGFIA